MTEPARQEPRVVHDEDLERQVSMLLDLGRDLGTKLRTRLQDAPEPPFSLDDKRLRDELRSALEDEVVPAVEKDSGTSPIQANELHREVVKKALVGLKVPALRKIAEQHRLERTGGLEELASRIALAYGWDEAEIARLVLANEPEPSPERSHRDRVFPLTRSPNWESIWDRLQFVLSRYIRIGVAKWFVFSELEREGKHLRLAGTLRTYNAQVTDEDPENPALAAIPSEYRAEVRFEAGEEVLAIRHANATTSRAAVRALQLATGLQPMGYVPLGQETVADLSPPFAKESLFLLDVLYNRLRALGQLNPTVAKFRLAREDAREVDSGDLELRPSLRSVKFEGDHLLDSVPACNLLAREGRALVDISMRIQTSTEPQDFQWFPVKIAIDRDHVLVQTGFGTVRPEESVALHTRVVEAIRAELGEGVADEDGLRELVQRIDRQARTGTPQTERAVMLIDPDDADR